MNTQEPMESETKMDKAIEVTRADLGFLKELILQARLVWRLLRDPEVPFYLKLLPALAAIYFISPIDFLPGLALPGIGALDDLTAVLVGAKMFIEFVPLHIVARHTEELEAEMTGLSFKERHPEEITDKIIIEGEYQKKD
ncbi:MAG: DUF1232 domain-containing protein [Chloroflexi bacterium]|nr:DUF1232 domain-containing protein [Chloroflexota bacterium]MBP8054312.1 DUF1232 domain-containing protein [Chloroflexota bacterium]